MSEFYNVKSWQCPRCDARTFTKGEVRMSGGFLAGLFNLDSRRFITAECNGCGYTEFFKRNVSGAAKILDFLRG